VAQVFISYSNEDRPRVESLAKAFEASGVSVFWDRRIPPGSTWRHVLDRELAGAPCVLVVWSKNSINSEWVLEEAESGRERGALVPVRLDPVAPPIGFRALQAADLTHWTRSQDDPAFVELLGTVRSRAELPPGETPPQARPRFPSRLGVVGGAVVIAIAALLIIWRAWDRHPPKTAKGYRRVYYEDFSQEKALPGGVWLLGPRGDWEGSIVDGRYRLCNRSGSSSASYTSRFSYLEVTRDRTNRMRERQ